MQHLRKDLPVQRGIIYDKDLLLDIVLHFFGLALLLSLLPASGCDYHIFPVLCPIHKLICPDSRIFHRFRSVHQNTACTDRKVQLRIARNL